MAATKQANRPVQIALGLVLVGLLVGAAAVLLVAMLDRATELSADVVAAIIAGLVSVFGLVWNRRQERSQAIAIELRAQKLPIYTGFIDFWFRTLLHKQMRLKEPTENEATLFFATFTKDIITWGSDDMLRAYSQFRGMADGQPLPMMYQFGEILLAIRSDLGHSNKGLRADDLMRLFVTDWDEHVAKTTSSIQPRSAEATRT